MALNKPMRSTMLTAAVLLAACGGKTTPKVQTVGPAAAGDSQQLAGGTGKGACKSKTDCPKARPDVASSGFANTGGLLGFKGEAVPWDFKGVDLNNADRKIAVLLNAIPAGAKVDPEISATAVFTSVKIIWTPDKKAKSSKDLEIHLRDLDRCLVDIGAERCNNGKKSLPDYDTVVKVKWQIEDKQELENLANGNGTDPNQNVVDVPDPNCGPAATTDSDIQGKILQGAIGVLTGGGGSLPSLLPGLLGSLGGGGGGSKPPQEC